ncbi:hypothetical protein D8674_004177 [Pyrus ussuriensis x Pyrus communis]|uniref:Uncharacterized protein n=1 Tax=Pyrus ussuriensis x Pyrus communis TaxID=2448454 RepID=A0A5N5FPJ1_9ROSA|nr:hypothetical protein D8674_004177 [Pyrus ussuriensis x Pyrus communis]
MISLISTFSSLQSLLRDLLIAASCSQSLLTQERAVPDLWVESVRLAIFVAISVKGQYF